MSFDLSFILVVIVLIFSLGHSLFLHFKIKKFLQGKDAATLEDDILQDRKKMILLEKENASLQKKNSELDKKLKESVRNVEVLRFNPFASQGSNQSFAISLLNESGDGIILSSLFSRERTSIFAKPVEKYASSYELTKEEREVLDKTKQKNGN
jgi:hypothetical protein